MFGGCGGEQRPDVGYGLLVGLRQIFELLFLISQHTLVPKLEKTDMLELIHGRFVSLASALHVRPVPVTVLGVGIRSGRATCSRWSSQMSILIGDVLGQEGGNGLAG